MDNFDYQQFLYQSKKVSEQVLSKVEAEHKKKVKWYSTFLKDFLPDDNQAKIIDLPCGYGNFLYFLKQKGYVNFIGYDIDPLRIELVKKLGLPGQIADAFNVLNNSSDLDLIVSLDFIEHITPEDALTFLSKCYRILKPGGRLIVRTPVTDSFVGSRDLYNDITHKWAGNSGVILSLFHQAGFHEVFIKDERPVPYKFINKIRLILFYFIKNITNLYFLLLGLSTVKIWSGSAFVIAKKK